MLSMFDRMVNLTAICLVKRYNNHVGDTKSNVRCQQEEKQAFIINQIIARRLKLE